MTESRKPRDPARERGLADALLDAAPTCIAVLDAEGRVLRVNPAFERAMAYGERRIGGEAFVELVTDPPNQAPLATFLDMVREEEHATAQVPVRRGDGATRWMRFSGALVHGTAEGTLILVGEDVTEQVKARETQMLARVQAEEGARAKSSFLASMSHEIRTPLNGILGMIEILLDTPLTPDQRHTAQVIRESGRGLLRVVNDVLDVSKIEAGQLDLEEVEFGLHALVGEVARIFVAAAAQRHNEIVVDVGDDVPRTVRGDPHRIRQILSNLVDNAVKFTEHGEVVLTLRSAAVADARHRIHFSVRDTGIGIAPEKQEQIFQEFGQADSSTTRTHGGTGLGLSISRRLVALMGGHIELTSTPGVGSDFHFALDVHPGVDERAAGVGEPGDVELAGRHFLVVDDNATARRVVREALHGVGARVYEAGGIEDGMRALHEAELGRPFDAVVLDNLLPGGDGFDFARRVRAEGVAPGTPILLVTSMGPRGGAERARAEGIAAYVPKPVSRPELLRALSHVLQPGTSFPTEGKPVTRESIGQAVTRLRILLAEDNAVNQQVAVGLLRKRGHDIVAVLDGAEAVREAGAGGFDLVLMDIQMPEMDGLEATRRIRAQPGNEKIPIVALTAHAFARERERCRDAGMNDFLAKPFEPDELYEMVERWAGGAGSVSGSKEEQEVDGDRESTVPPVDLEGFRATMRAAGVEEVVDTALEVYLSEAPALFGGIETAVTAGVSEDVRRAAHSLKSASGNIRAVHLAELLQSLEDLGKDGDLEGARAMMGQVGEEYRAVVDYLETTRGG